MIYLWDSGGNAWDFYTNVDGQPFTRKVGPLAVGAATILNPSDGTVANSWRLDISTGGVITTVAIAYSAANPTAISPNGLLDWTLTILASGALQWVWGLGLGLPKIVYPSSLSGGVQTTLYFRHPARFVPAHFLSAVKHVNRASSGTQETLLERIDEFFEGVMEYVASGSDIAAWRLFMLSALAGIPFDYYPDSSLAAFTTYYLDDQEWKAEWKAPQRYTFKLRFYKYVTWP